VAIDWKQKSFVVAVSHFVECPASQILFRQIIPISSICSFQYSLHYVLIYIFVYFNTSDMPLMLTISYNQHNTTS